MFENPDDLTIYSKPGCPWCIAVISYLQNEGYEFTEVDVVASDKQFQKMVEISGQSLVPTIAFGDHVLPDCGISELKKFIKNHNIQLPVSA